MPRQLSFDLPSRNAQGADNFFVSPSNERAFALINGWQNWPDGKLALSGPQGSGKTHLARVWRELSRATIFTAAALGPASALPDDGACIAVEDMEALPRAAEEYMFHLHNHLRATGGYLLLSARQPPVNWPIKLPDLASRMQAASMIRLDDPDDLLLSAVLTKQFADRQLNPPPDLVPYLAARIERSFAAATQMVEALDQAALAAQKPIGKSLARSVLAQFGAR